MRIALTGGIACGKSLVAKFLNEFGVETIDADDIVHELLPDPAERRRIAAEVFADPAKRQALEAKLHPLVKDRIERWLGEDAREDARRKTEDARSGRETLDARRGLPSHVSRPAQSLSSSVSRPRFRLAIIPLLLEARWERNFDIICCVRSARATQVDRMTATRGYTREEAEARLEAQMPVEAKAAKSHYVIDNDGSPEELKLKVAKFVEWLRSC